MNKYYSISNLVICFQSETFINTSELFSDFLSENAKPDINVTVIRGKLPETENGLYKTYPVSGKERRYSCRVRKAHNEYDLFIDYPDGIWDSMLFYALDFSSVLLENNRVMCHCSFIVKDGEAILFAGIKHAGKSTQAELWRKYRNAEIVNGDRAILMMNGSELYACGTPYCGSSKIALNRIVPVKAMVLLQKDTTNTVSVLKNKNECLKSILPHLSYVDSHIDEMLNMAQKICSNVTFYVLNCLPDENAVSVMESALWKEETVKN